MPRLDNVRIPLEQRHRICQQSTPGTNIVVHSSQHSNRQSDASSHFRRCCCQMNKSSVIPWKLSLAGAATSVIFVATKHVFCLEKKVCLPRQKFCRDKMTFVASKCFWLGKRVFENVRTGHFETKLLKFYSFSFWSLLRPDITVMAD